MHKLDAQPNPTFWRLFVALCALIGVFFVVTATPQAASGTQAEQAEQTVGEDPCEQPCPGEDDDGDCLDECYACGCCASIAPAVFSSFQAPPSMTSTPRGDLPGMCTSGCGGISMSLFKPPRYISA